MTIRLRVDCTLPRRLAALGIAPDAVLRRAGLPAGLFDQPRIQVTTDEFFALYRGMAACSPDPAVGLALAESARPEQYDPVAIAGLYARSFRDAIGRMARYKQLICPERLHLAERGERAVVRFVWTESEAPQPPALVDHCFGWLVGIGRHGTGIRLCPARVELMRAPAHGALYEAHFGCPVVFDQPRDALVFERVDLDRPFVSHNPDLLGLIAPGLEAELARMQAAGGLGERVKGVLKRELAGRGPDVGVVARALAMSVRTLQRRLGEQGLVFRALVAEARHELARHYLAASSMELAEVAYLLGYEDANSFFRAFRRWEGVPPGQWRLRVG